MTAETANATVQKIPNSIKQRLPKRTYNDLMWIQRFKSLQMTI